MARIFITGSADGLGLMAARLLVQAGHRVVVHGRSPERADEALASVPGADAALAGDLSSLAQMRDLAEQANRTGPFDAVIHNAAVGYREPKRIETVDGLAHVFAINTLAPYVLTALMHRPRRLVYLSSGLHHSGDPGLRDLNWSERRWNGSQAYSDSKLHDALLAAAIARRWPDVLSNAVEPGWVATRMGGAGAPDDLSAGPRTQAWLASSDDAAATVSGGYFYHQRPRSVALAVLDTRVQDSLMDACASISRIPWPT